MAAILFFMFFRGATQCQVFRLKGGQLRSIFATGFRSLPRANIVAPCHTFNLTFLNSSDTNKMTTQYSDMKPGPGRQVYTTAPAYGQQTVVIQPAQVVMVRGAEDERPSNKAVTIFACFVFWCCCWPLGLAAFSLSRKYIPYSIEHSPAGKEERMGALVKSSRNVSMEGGEGEGGG